MTYVRWGVLGLFLVLSVVDCVCAETGRSRFLKPLIIPLLAAYYFLSSASPSKWIVGCGRRLFSDRKRCAKNGDRNAVFRFGALCVYG